MSDKIRFSRQWAMPSPDTFSVKPIGEFVRRYLAQSKVSIDPFARDCQWATHTNDLNPNTTAQSHVDAEAFLIGLTGIGANLFIFDPPYSPEQISRCYKGIGLPVTTADTQNSRLYKRVRDAAMPLLDNDAIALSFGWNTVGMGKGRGFQLIEIMMVCHGGAHNDTICIAEQRINPP